MTELTVRILITGRVQGVGYRQACRDQARALALAGWVRNLDDGRVEAMVHGEETPVRELIGWMHEGPTMARVDEVDIAPAVADLTAPFEVRQ